MLYADANAVLKLYFDEPDSDVAHEILRGDPEWVSACVTAVEVRRNLARLLAGDDLERARAEFKRDWSEVVSIVIDDATSDRAARLAEVTGVRSLDALHLGAAASAGVDEGLPLVTFDGRLRDAARSLGWTVLPE